jgi:3-oxoadipate enol-lactonase
VIVTAGGIGFGCDRGGSGDPVILVMGLGAPRLGWFPQFAVLSQSYDVVTFDNRGVGETKATAPWTIQDNAADVIAIADELGFERFHLAGISMGGMISQEVVLSYPERVRSVTLMSTSPGGPEAQMMTPEFQQALAEPDPARRMRVVAEATFGRKFRTEHPEMMDMILTGMESGAAGVSPIGGEMGEGFMAQVMAAATWMGAGGSSARLKEIDVPTLVLHGGDDLLIPLSNGEVLARDIPGARMRVWPDAGHALNFEAVEDVNSELVSHFEAASARV